MSARSPHARTLSAASRVSLLERLQSTGASTVGELANVTGLHENTTREHLARLVAAGYVVREPEHRNLRGRPRMVYRAVSADDMRADPVSRRRLEDSIASAALTRALLASYGQSLASPAQTALEAGREQGRERPLPQVLQNGATPPADPVERQLLALEAHLDTFGFDPEVDPDHLRVHMWRCPFADLARERTEIVCSVHMGLATGVLEAVGGPVRAEAIRPFVDRSHCVIELGLATPEPGSAGAEQ
jgi:predicted ArsR family transcriptional regulator